MQHSIRIATRKSPLAMWQAEYVRDRLLALHPGLRVQLLPMTTRGDKILDTPLAKVGGKGLFVKELEQGLLSCGADLAVHSMKDVPVEFPDGLALPVICEREDPRDALVSNRYAELAALPPGAKVGTSSLRRQCQLRARFPGLVVLDLRGNVNTRLRKLDEGAYDAILLACAGLQRLGLGGRITRALTPRESLPAVGQGAVGIECRAADTRTLDLIMALDHADTHCRVAAERAFSTRLAGGCQVPIAGHAVLEGDALTLEGLVGRPDGGEIVRRTVHGIRQAAEALGRRLADELLARGAGAILKDAYDQS